MLNRMSLKMKLGTGFGLLLTILVSLGVAAYRTIVSADGAAAEADRKTTEKELASSLATSAMTESSGTRGYMLTGEEKMLEKDGQGKPEIKQAMEKLATLVHSDEGKRKFAEIERTAGALNKMKNNLQKTIQSISENAQHMASASEELSSTSQQITANSEETSAQASVVTQAAQRVNQNLQSLSTGAEEMTSTIQSIAINAHEAATVASKAVQAAQAANSTVGKLGESSAEIGEVIKAITSIAQQTNLLALNTTIEAARAGEAGKGALRLWPTK